MTFKIVDGREHFYQWDLNRQIIVDDPAIKEVHFCNRNDDCSLVVEVVDGKANVPNILLQKSFSIHVFAYDGFATRYDAVFEVKARTQPSDYVYTETDIRRYEDLAQRIDEIERNGISEEVINNAVNKFLEENPVDLTDYATKNYVDTADATLNLLLTQHNHDGYYADKNHTHSDYTTKTYVDNAVKNVKPDLTGYAKKTDIPDVSKFITSIPSEYVTESELEAKKYAKSSELSSYAKTNHKHSMADVNGLQTALNNKATQADIEEAISNIKIPEAGEMNNVVFIDKTADSNSIKSILNDGKWPVYFADKGTASPRLYPLIEKNGEYFYFGSNYENQYYAAKYDGYTNTWSQTRGDFLKNDDLSGYATESYVDNAIANTEIPSVDGLASEQWVKDNTVSKATGQGLSNSINNLATHKADIEYVNEAISNIKIPDVDLSNYYTKSEVDGAIENVEVDLTGYATEQYVDESIANIEIPDDTEVIELNLGAEDDNVFVSKEIASRINVNPEKCIIKVSNNAINDTYYRFDNQALNEESLLKDVRYSAVTLSSAGNDIIPTILHIRILYVTDINTVSHAIASLRKTILKNGQTIDTDNYYTKSETYSKTEVDEAIAGAGGSGGGGASYTFTNGLTETDGTVTNDFYTSMRVDAGGNAAIIYPEGDGTVGDTFNNGTSKGSLIVCNSHRSSWSGRPTVEVDMSKGVIAFGNVTGYTGGMSDYAIRSSGSQGVLVGGYATGKANGAIYAYARGSVVVGIADDTTGAHKVSHYGSSALGRSLQSTTSDQFLVGRCNSTTDMSKMAFIIGNGTNNTTRSNALTVDKSGNLVAAGTVTPTGADYAEYFEFEDGNPNKEDRIGYLVELINGKIRFANGTDIIGATSGSKGVIGDAEEMNWHGKYERDEFGRYIYEDVPVVNGKGTEDEYTEVIHTKKISANYDPNRAYTPRSKRPEWYPVGLLGKVLVRHDGTLSAGDYVKAINGIASKSEEKTNIRVLEVVSENVIRVLIK